MLRWWYGGGVRLEIQIKFCSGPCSFRQNFILGQDLERCERCTVADRKDEMFKSFYLSYIEWSCWTCSLCLGLCQKGHPAWTKNNDMDHDNLWQLLIGADNSNLWPSLKILPNIQTIRYTHVDSVDKICIIVTWWHDGHLTTRSSE